MFWRETIRSKRDGEAIWPGHENEFGDHRIPLENKNFNYPRRIKSSNVKKSFEEHENKELLISLKSMWYPFNGLEMPWGGWGTWLT